MCMGVTGVYEVRRGWRGREREEEDMGELGVESVVAVCEQV